MEIIIIVIHLMIVFALVGVVLLQRSEGGGLGIGGGSGFMTARGAANSLTRITAILAAAFFVTSLALSILARYGDKPIDILNRPPESGSTTNGGGGGVLDKLGGSATPAQPAPPATADQPTPPSTADQPATPPASSETPAAPAAPAGPQVPNQ